MTRILAVLLFGLTAGVAVAALLQGRWRLLRRFGLALALAISGVVTVGVLTGYHPRLILAGVVGAVAILNLCTLLWMKFGARFRSGGDRETRLPPRPVDWIDVEAEVERE